MGALSQLTGPPVFSRPELPLSDRQLNAIADAAVASKQVVDFHSWQRWKRVWSKARSTVAERQARLADSEWRTRYYGDTAVQYKTFDGRRQEL